MAVPEKLAASAGSWSGTNRLHDPHSGAPEDSPSTMVLTPILKNKFLRLDYTWAYQGDPQEGSLWVGGDPKTGEVIAHWIDTWHMSDGVLVCRGGPAHEDGSISVRGSYAAPPGPDWGWRIDIQPGDGRTLRVVMFNITPEGQEDMAVEASYTRA